MQYQQCNTVSRSLRHVVGFGGVRGKIVDKLKSYVCPQGGNLRSEDGTCSPQDLLISFIFSSYFFVMLGLFIGYLFSNRLIILLGRQIIISFLNQSSQIRSCWMLILLGVGFHSLYNRRIGIIILYAHISNSVRDYKDFQVSTQSS